MSSAAWLIVIVGLLTLLGSVTLLVVTVKFYWGDRGAPPKTGAARRAAYEEEMRLRAKQLEYVRAHPREMRKPDFFDNSKRRG